ncbi:glutamate--cysteine ligase [Corynebacterium pseudopelargi]|uniref:Putative glutamate--cysteine ligase 2 n=1 Tax=Corynebacterium pseudopelargi TaxID=2080757 RepID=A0A3G6IS83_9CORY|nr:glutamate--cysteine ligase [Corynebacterium pseudopelargi]AZA08436.1 Carboxylate-amine ligase YbdK [Corynebacterium pseudopelargi]
MAQAFHASPEPTLGVEWELAIADPHTRDLIPAAKELIERASAIDPEVQFEHEFLANTVEIVTPVCKNTAEAIAALRRGLQALLEAADEQEVALWSSGSHPFAKSAEQKVGEKGHYNEIIERTQFWGTQMLIWGLHVHVGISDKDRVWPIINALMTYYPHLLALSASSPGWEGLDTGYASNRTMLYQQLPTAGMPYQFQSWGEWEDFMVDQDRSGVISHTGSMHFDIRPAGKWGTIEVRVSDAAPKLEEMAALVALTHCLVVYLDQALARGEEVTVLQPWHVAENKWRAARYGLDAIVVTSRDTDEHLVSDELRELVSTLLPTAKRLGCEEELLLVNTIVDQGAPYQRQRALYQQSGSWQAVVDQSIAEVRASAQG